MWTGGASVTSGGRSFGDSLASEAAEYRGTMADSDARGSEKPEDSESSLKKLENLVAKLAQDLKQDIDAVVVRVDKIVQDSSESEQEIKQEIGAVVTQMDLMGEDLQAA